MKTSGWAKHAQHFVLIHFPIALFIAAVAFDLVAHFMKRQGLADAAYYNLLAQRFQHFQFSPPAFSRGSPNSRGKN